MSPTSIAAYVVLFGSVGLLFLAVSLLLGRLLRPSIPTAAKLDAYECGEPAVGTSFIQFDLRFYVVALVFIVFEVEVAMFFPPAVIYGAATRWMKADAGQTSSEKFATEMGVPDKQNNGQGSSPAAASPSSVYQTANDARAIAVAAAADLAAFFAIILLGFAYVWRRGDLNWVRATDAPQSRPARQFEVIH